MNAFVEDTKRIVRLLIQRDPVAVHAALFATVVVSVIWLLIVVNLLATTPRMASQRRKTSQYKSAFDKYPESVIVADHVLFKYLDRNGPLCELTFHEQRVRCQGYVDGLGTIPGYPGPVVEGKEFENVSLLIRGILADKYYFYSAPKNPRKP